MHNLATVIIFEFVRTIKKKTFWLSLLAFPVLIGAVYGAIYLSNTIAEEASLQQQEEGFSLVVLDNSGLILPEVLSTLSATEVESRDEGIERVKYSQADAFIYYPTDPTQTPIEVFAKDEGIAENAKYTVVAEEILRSSASSAINSPQLIDIIRGNIQSTLTTYQDGEPVPGFERVLAPGIFLVLFYALIVLLANQMLTSTTEEKENRVIEMILTTVQARTLIIGKIIALVLLGIVQVLVISSPMVVAYVYGGDTVSNLLPAINLNELVIDWGRVGLGALIFVLSFMLFTGLLVAIGAAVPTAKEANSFFGVIVLAMFLPLYSAMAVVSDPSQLIVKIFTYFPLSAPVTLLLRNAVGNLSAIEAIIGVAILLASGVLAMAIAIHTFRYGTLEYNRKLSLGEILRFQ